MIIWKYIFIGTELTLLRKHHYSSSLMHQTLIRVELSSSFQWGLLHPQEIRAGVEVMSLFDAPTEHL
jgi:hypothetical protein